MKLLDLLFYKLYVVYKKKNDPPIFSSVLALGGIYLTILLFVGITLNLLFGIDFSELEKTFVLIIIACFTLPFMAILFYRYTRKDKIKKISNEYSKEKYKWLRFWHIVVILPCFFILSAFAMVLIFGNPLFFAPNQ